MSKFFLSFVLPIILFVLILGGATTYSMLDAFVLDREIGDGTHDTLHTFAPVNPPVTPSTSDNTAGGDVTSDAPAVEDDPEEAYPIIKDLYYKDANIEIAIEEIFYENKNKFNNRVFVVDLKLSSVEYLKTFINTSSSGKVSTERVSVMAKKNNAIFAINGDYFSYRKGGFVVRNYEIWRDTAKTSNDKKKFGDDALLILSDGSFKMIDEYDIKYNGKVSAYGLPSNTYQCFSFGPRLIENGKVMVDRWSEVGQSAESNPRTAIGMVEPLHYKIVVAEGRIERYNGNDGLELYEVANLMDMLGCVEAYNLDGGSSTTLYFNGRVLNELTKSGEREVSDCIFINGMPYTEEGAK